MVQAENFFTEQFNHYLYYVCRILINDNDVSKFVFIMYYKNPYDSVIITNLTKDERDSLVSFIKTLDSDVAILKGSFW